MRLVTEPKRVFSGLQNSGRRSEEIVETAQLNLKRELVALDLAVTVDEFIEMYWEPVFRIGRALGIDDSAAAHTAVGVLRWTAHQQQGMTSSRFGISTYVEIKNALARMLVKALARIGDGVPDGLTSLLEGPPQVAQAFNAAWDAEWDRHLMGLAVERVRNQTDPRQFEIFELYAMRRCAPSYISESYGVSPGNLYVTKHRIAARIRKELTALRTELGN